MPPSILNHRLYIVDSIRGFDFEGHSVYFSASLLSITILLIQSSISTTEIMAVLEAIVAGRCKGVLYSGDLLIFSPRAAGGVSGVQACFFSRIRPHLIKLACFLHPR
jgi:hypothetical protein